jgi:hypothetical protein
MREKERTVMKVYETSEATGQQLRATIFVYETGRCFALKFEVIIKTNTV